MTPQGYPCRVFYGPHEWKHEGMRYGCSSILCYTQSDFKVFQATMSACYYSVRAIAYFAVRCDPNDTGVAHLPQVADLSLP